MLPPDGLFGPVWVPRHIHPNIGLFFGYGGPAPPGMRPPSGMGVPGDYVWNERAMQDIMNRLHEQHSGSECQPASESTIDSLPYVEVVESNGKCTSVAAYRLRARAPAHRDRHRVDTQLRSAPSARTAWKWVA